MTATNRKTPFLGFAMAIEAVTGLFNDLVKPTENPPLRYLLTYKLSQDHLEHFFRCIRLRGGCNNNPTVTQFVTAYKHLLVHHEVKVSNGNCKLLENTTILTANSVWNHQDSEQPDQAQTIARNMIKYDLVPNTARKTESDNYDIPDPQQLSQYVENAVTYIAGFVTRNLLKHLKCKICAGALSLTTESPRSNSDKFHLIAVKDRGGLISPSLSTVTVC